jgi:hypothetical protein
MRCLSAVFLALSIPLLAQAQTLKVTVESGPHARVNVPIKATLILKAAAVEPAKTADIRGEGMTLVGQITPLGLGNEPPAVPPDRVVRELHFVVPKLAANQTATFDVTLAPLAAAPASFRWKDTPGELTELFLGDKPVLSYMYRTFDDSTKLNRDITYKVFHHLYDPDGKRLVTKGDGGKYPHHRGLFYGFNKTTYGDKKNVDIWHCTGDTHQAHVRTLELEAGPVLARQRVEIAWNGIGKQTFAVEQREITVYRVPGGQLVEFASRVKSKAGEVTVDGDPQHAGFHFRAANEVAETTTKQTYYLRPNGKGELGTERNWPAQKDHVNLPWNVMSFVLGEQRYSAVYLDRPQNPKEARFSERTYGRFGSYFVAKFDEQKPLDVRYRIWLQAGEISANDAKRLSADFVEGPKTSVK